jgi:hypothetical protein
MCINSSLLRLSFCLFSTLIFPFYKTLFRIKLEFSCFADFFVRILKTRVEYGFLYNPPVEGTVNSMEQRLECFLLNLSPKIQTPEWYPQYCS